MLACTRRSEWDAFCDAIERPGLATSWGSGFNLTGGGEGTASADGVTCEIAEILRTRTASEWETLAGERDIPLVAVEMRDPGRFNMEDAEMRRLGHAVRVTSPVHGEYWRHGALQTFSDAPQTFGPWDPLGGHTAAILGEVGYSEDEISRMAAEKVVEIWQPETE